MLTMCLRIGAEIQFSRIIDFFACLVMRAWRLVVYGTRFLKRSVNMKLQEINQLHIESSEIELCFVSNAKYRLIRLRACSSRVCILVAK